MYIYNSHSMPVLYYKTISTHVYVYDNAFYNSHSKAVLYYKTISTHVYVYDNVYL